MFDPMLSLSFLYWPLLGPNDFHRVDRLVWLLNWSLPGKAANTGGVILAIALGQYGLALAVAVAVLAVKLWTAVRLQGLPAPFRLWPSREPGNGVNAVTVGLALATGVGSAPVPVLNAEAWALFAATGPVDTLLAVVLALAAGQTVGKLVLFESGRRGRDWHPWRRRLGVRPHGQVDRTGHRVAHLATLRASTGAGCRVDRRAAARRRERRRWCSRSSRRVFVPCASSRPDGPVQRPRPAPRGAVVSCRLVGGQRRPTSYSHTERTGTPRKSSADVRHASSPSTVPCGALSAAWSVRT